MTTVNGPVAGAGHMSAVHAMFRRSAVRAAVVSRPGLWARLEGAARVTVVSAPPGSGKTMLLRSWIDAAGLAERTAWVPEGRRGQAQVLLGVVRLQLARQRGNLPAVAEEAQRLQALAEAPDAAQPGLGEELRALALVSLGVTEFWAARLEAAQRHLEQGVALARRIGRPYLEFSGLAYQAVSEIPRSLVRVAERSRQAIELAERHGWTDEPAAG